MAKLKKIITEEMLRNMEMLAVTSAAMRDILEQAKVIYELAGAPDFFDADTNDYTKEVCEEELDPSDDLRKELAKEKYVKWKYKLANTKYFLEEFSK